MASDRPSRTGGTPTPASQVSAALTRAGFARYLVRKSTALGGHRCSWVQHLGATEVRYRAGDDVPEGQAAAERADMLGRYRRALTRAGYTVTPDSTGTALRVPPKNG